MDLLRANGMLIIEEKIGESGVLVWLNIDGRQKDGWKPRA